MPKNRKVIVIGGGPAGMMAAGTAAIRGLDVTLIEKNPILGKKLLITGKNRCNITNYSDVENLIANASVNGKFLYTAFYTFTSFNLIELLNSLGLKTKVERGNRVFPASDKSTDVVNTLKKYLKDNDVKVVRGNVSCIKSENKKFRIILKNSFHKQNSRSKDIVRFKENLLCDSLIIATGGKSYPETGSTGDGYKFAKDFGHTIIPLKPSLVPIEAKSEWASQVQGLSLRNVGIKILDKNGKKVYQDFGEMLFTHFGVSGPIILSASSHIRNINNHKLVIDLKPSISKERLDRRILRDFAKHPRKKFSNLLKWLLPKKIIPIIIELLQISAEKPVNEISKEERENLVKLLKNLTLKLDKFRPLKEAIITSGGVNVDEINPRTMESKIVKGLFFAGEIIDVDAYTGGFNLQIAFSTGYLAGLNC